MELVPWDGAIPSETWSGGRLKTSATAEPLHCGLIANFHLFSIIKYEVTKLLSQGWVQTYSSWFYNPCYRQEIPLLSTGFSDFSH